MEALENPCTDCRDDEICGNTCSKYRYWLAVKAGEAFTREVIQSAESIKARPEQGE